MTQTDVLLTQRDVVQRKEEKAELERRLAADQKKLAEVNRWLEAAAILVGDTENEERQPEAAGEVPEAKELEPMTAAVMRVIYRLRGADRHVIKTALREVGYPENRLGNYFYTVMARHVAKGHLVKVGSRYTLPKNGEAPSNPAQTGLLDASNETGLTIQ